MLIKQLALFCLPISWFGAKNLFFIPHGPLVNYNTLVYKYLVVGFCIFAFISFSALTFYYREHVTRSSNGLRFFLIMFGFAVLVSGMLPYFSVGYFPPYVSWNSRHEYLQPFGVSIIALGISAFFSSIGMLRLAKHFPKMIIGIATITTFLFSLSFLNDASKQASIIELIKEDSRILKSSTIIFNDKTTKTNIFDRPYDSTEWSGFLHRAFGDTTRFGLNANQSEIYRLFNSDFVNSDSKLFIPDRYIVRNSAVFVTISYFEPSIGLLENVPILRYFAFSRPRLTITSRIVTDINRLISDL